MIGSVPVPVSDLVAGDNDIEVVGFETVGNVELVVEGGSPSAPSPSPPTTTPTTTPPPTTPLPTTRCPPTTPPPTAPPGRRRRPPTPAPPTHGAADHGAAGGCAVLRGLLVRPAGTVRLAVADDERAAAGSFLGEHDMACNGPTTYRTVHQPATSEGRARTPTSTCQARSWCGGALRATTPPRVT